MVDEEVEKNQQTPKTYTEEEVTAIREQMKADNQKAWDNRWGKEKSKMERNYARESQKKDEALNLIMEQTGVKNIDDLLDVSYKQYNVERPQTQLSQEDEETLGKSDADKILGYSDEEIEQEAERLSYLERTTREEATFQKLGAYLKEKKQEKEFKEKIKALGIDETEFDNDDFKKFANNYKETTPFEIIYENYKATKPPKEKPFSAGSLQGSKVENKSLVKDYYTYEESLQFTRKDYDENPALYKAVKESMSKWSRK